MAVLGRLLISSAERLDLPDLLSIDSYTAGDFKYLLKGLVGDSRPYILKGFEVIDPLNAIGTQNCSIRVADSVVFYPGSTSGPFFHGLQEGHPQAQPLVPELRKNAVNYVYLTFSTFNTSVDTRAFWDPDKDGGAGGEFTQDVNTESVLKVDVNVSVGSFPANTIPIAKITVGPVVITKIEDARDMMFRLGTGGLNPDPFSRYTWRSQPLVGYERTEPPTEMIAGGVNPFKGADKNIQSLKEWMDAIMSKIAELGGTTYWYQDASTYNLVASFVDALATGFKSKGQWVHDSSIPGQVTWTEDINIKITSDPRTYIVRSGTKTLNDEQVLYIPLTRKALFNGSDQEVQWLNGQNYINTIGGAIGLFANLQKGDWVKKIDDPNHYFVRVEEFYDSVSLGGSVTTPANAKSIRLNTVYLGTSAQEKGRYDKGVYLASDTVASDRNQAALSTIGGNFHWMALRSDTNQSISSIAETLLTIDITEADGLTAKCTSTAPHGLVDGDRVTISGTVSYNGVYKVEVESSTVFYISTTGTGDELGVSAGYAIVTTSTRSTLYGLQLESANHGFKSDETVQIENTSGYNGAHEINVRNSTSFNIALANGNETVGNAILARVIVRAEQGVFTLVQGASGEIGGSEAQAIRTFLGMTSPSQANPFYAVPQSYNTIDGMANYNSLNTDTVTDRLSKLTAMMADKAQDKTMKYILRFTTTITNTTNGSNQEITFAPALPGPELILPLPGSGVETSVNLPTVAPGISLPINSVAYIEVDRNANTVSPITVASLLSCPIGENIFVVAIRLGDGNVYIWDGLQIPPGASIPSLSHLFTIVRQNRNMKLVAGGAWSWNLGTETLSWTNNANIMIPGLDLSDNQINAGSVVLGLDQVAYVDINRFSPGGSLSVHVSDVELLTLTDDRLVIAWRDGNDVIVGNSSMKLYPGQSKSLDGDTSIVKVRAMDSTSTSLPGGPSVTIDGISLVDGDTVLFTALTTISDRGVYVVDGIGVSATWMKIRPFDGFDTPRDGSMVWVQEGNSPNRTMWHYDGIDWKQFDNSGVTGEQTGFPSRTTATLSFDDATRTFTIAPISSNFDFYQKGVRYRISSPQTITIPNNEGLHYIYFNNGSLASTQTFTIEIIKEYAFVATVQWDATNGEHIMLGDERHGLTMDGETHGYLHQAIGMRYISGLSAGNFTLGGTGSLDSDAQLSISNGRVRDEDIAFDIIDDPAPNAPFEQVLDPIAEIPVFYRDGASGDWRKQAITQFPIPVVGSSPVIEIQTMPGVGYGFSFVMGLDVFGQTFTPSTSFSVEAITLNMHQISASGQVCLEIWNTVSGFPDSTSVIGVSDPINASSISPSPTYGPVTFTFSTPVPVVAFTQYAFVFKEFGFATGSFEAEYSAGSYSGGDGVFAPDPGLTGTWANIGLGTDFAFEIYSSLGGGPTFPVYNNPSGWSLDQVTDGYYYAVWLFATNNQSAPIIAIAGQREDPTLTDAQENNRYDTLLLGNLPSAEMKILYRLIYKYNSTYTNSVFSTLEDINDLRRAIDTSLGTYAPGDHGLLTGLTDQDHPANAIYTDTTNFNNILNGSDTDVQLALDKLDNNSASVSNIYQDRNLKLVRGGIWRWLNEATLANAYNQPVQNFSFSIGIPSPTAGAGQSFQALVGGDVQQVTLNLYDAFAGGVGQLYVEIYNASGGLPTTSLGVGVLATSNSVNVSTLSTIAPSPVTFTFSSTTTLIAGQQYAIILRGVGVSAAIFTGADNTNPIPIGNPCNWFGSSWGVIVGGSDIVGTVQVAITTSELSCSEDAFVQIPGLPENRNRIVAGSFSLPNDGDVAYVDVNRTAGPPATLTVNTSPISGVIQDNNRLVIARRLGNDVIVGAHSMRLSNRQGKPIDGEIGGQLLEQLRILSKTGGDKKRVRIAGSDLAMFTGQRLIQEIGSLKMSFTGAEIDFADGNIYGGDSSLPLSTDFTTPLGVNFTPPTIPAGQYMWYSIALNPSVANPDGTIGVQVSVSAGAPGATPDVAEKPALAGAKKLGYVVVRDNGAGGSGTILDFDAPSFTLPGPLAQNKVYQLGVGAGGSGSGTGFIKVRALEDDRTTLPTGLGIIIDGVTINAGDEVLFTNLTLDNNKVYKAQGVGTNITGWVAQYVFNGGISTSPADGDFVFVKEGEYFADNVYFYNGTTFNNFLNYKISQTLLDNQLAGANMFIVEHAKFQHLTIEYSVKRDTNRRTGNLFVACNGTSASLADFGTSLGDIGITFDAIVSGSYLIVRYISTSTGFNATFERTVRAW